MMAAKSANLAVDWLFHLDDGILSARAGQFTTSLIVCICVVLPLLK